MRCLKVVIAALIIFTVGCTNPDDSDSKTNIPEENISVSEGDGLLDDDDSSSEVEDDDDSGEVEVEEEEEDPITWEDCSGAPGEKACDFTFKDQDGTDWSLYDHYGTVMVVDFSTIWCGVCRSIAGDVQAHQDAYTDKGYDFLWVTVLVDGPAWGIPPEESEIQDWVDAYGMTTSPVLVGDRTVIDTTAEDGYPIVSWPTLVVIDETMTVHNGVGGWSESMVFGWVDEALGIVR